MSRLTDIPYDARLLGRQPNDPRKARVTLHAKSDHHLDVPQSADWLSEVAEWPMLLNDKIGDCTAAGAGHFAQMVNWYGQRQVTPVAEADALAMYEAVSGYDPRDPSTDVGATLQDALNYWRKTGIGGNMITAFAQIDAQDLDLVRACIAIFGGVYTGMNFPANAMSQFNSGKPWVIKGRSRVIGGHCVPVHAYGPSGFWCVTWGRVQAMDVDFYRRYFDEVWVPIDLDWLSTSGMSPAGLDIDALNADFTALTGEPGPFEKPAPAPQPAPKPEPVPGDDPDSLLVAAFETWKTAKHL